MRLINKFLDQYEKYDVLKRRYGQRIASQRLSMFGKGPETSRPLQRVEVDNTPLDVLVIDESTSLVLGRPWITVMIDRYSLMVVGFHVSFRKPSVQSVLRCLRHAMLPKTYMSHKYPGLKGEWPCFGLIELMVCDNGLEFHAKDLEAACSDVGTHLLFCQPRTPHLKGVIERFLKTLNYNLLHLVPGTTYANYVKRLDYDSASKAVLTMSELQLLLHKWIVEIYGATFHRGINAAPLQRWAEGVAVDPPELAPDPERLKVYLGQAVKRQLDRNGVQIHNLRYTSPALQRILAGRKVREVTVRYDPDDLAAVHVLDVERKEYVPASCTSAAYAHGLTLEQHNLLTRKAKENYKALPFGDAVLAAKLEMREFTQRLLKSRATSTSRRKRRQATVVEALRYHAEIGPFSLAEEGAESATQNQNGDHIASWIADRELSAFDVESVLFK